MACLLNVMAIRRSRVSMLGMYIVIMMTVVLCLKSMQSFRYTNERDSSNTWIRVLMSDVNTTKNEDQRPSAILFTTFKNQPDRLFLQYNTIRNWASLRPFVQPVLFTTSQREDGTDLLEQMARDSGWHLYPAPSVNSNGLPFVRPMFQLIEWTYSGAMFRGYSNGDLLFDDSLKKNIQAIARNAFHLKRSVLIGNHTVYGGSFVNEKNTVSKDLLRAKVEKAGSKTNGSKGYAILGGPYPWEKFPELVVGRRGLNNFIVHLAAAHGATIIDATKSLLAVHQSVKSGTASHPTGKDADFNVNAVVRAYGLANESMVNTPPVHYLTSADFLGNMHIINNPSAPKPAVKMAKEVEKKPKIKTENSGATGYGKNNEIKTDTKDETKQQQNKEHHADKT